MNAHPLEALLSIRMLSRVRLPLVAAVWILCAVPFRAQVGVKPPPCCTYYVSSSGNDAYPGTSLPAAWHTIGRVNQEVLHPGDKVLFEGGSVFPGTIVLGGSESGTPQAPITFGSYGTGQAEIWANEGTGFDLVDVGGIRIEDLFVSGSGLDTNDGIGISFYTELPGDVKFRWIRIENCRVSGFRRGGISIGAWNGRSGFRDVRVEGCRLDHNGNNGMAVWGYYDPAWGQTVTDYPHRTLYIRHNVFESNWGDPQLTNKHTGSGCEVAQAAQVVIERNVAFDNGRLNSFAGGGPVGIWAWDVLQTVIQYNESHHNSSGTVDGGGFDFDGGSKSCWMQYNYSHDNDGAGFMVAQFANGSRPMSDVTVRYNVSERDGGRSDAGALQLWNGDSLGPPLDTVRFYNNTVFVEAKPSLSIPRAFRAFGPGDVISTSFNNNIFYSRGSGVWLGDTSFSPAPSWIGNLYFAESGPFVIRQNGISYSSLADWRLATGQEIYQSMPSGYEADPLLVSAGNGGTIGDADALTSLTAYQLLPASPFQDLGLVLPISVGATDFWGITLFQGTGPAIGAHEGL